MESKLNANVTVELVKGSAGQYIIKDCAGITVGRIFFLELNEENKCCTFRIKFYKVFPKNSIILKSTLDTVLRTLMIDKKMYKVNTICDSNMDLTAFVEKGYKLQGVLDSNIYSEGSYRDEFIFGITKADLNVAGMKNTFELTGKNIKLKVLSPTDDSQMLSYYVRNKEHLSEFEPTRDEKFYTIETQRKILSDGYLQYLNGHSLNLGIIKQDMIIGKVQISNIVEGIFKNAFVGYSIDREYQGRGYMKEALSIVLKYAFQDLGLHRVEASTLVDNYKSQSVLKACGFKQIGTNKKYLYINGKWRDHISYYIINEE